MGQRSPCGRSIVGAGHEDDVPRVIYGSGVVGSGSAPDQKPVNDGPYPDTAEGQQLTDAEAVVAEVEAIHAQPAEKEAEQERYGRVFADPVVGHVQLYFLFVGQSLLGLGEGQGLVLHWHWVAPFGKSIIDLPSILDRTEGNQGSIPGSRSGLELTAPANLTPLHTVGNRW